MRILAESAVIVAIAALASGIGVALVLRRARARGMLDIPNARSSHTAPTPRGGGLAIVATVCAAVVAAYAYGRLDGAFTLALLGGGIAIAAVGWVDDIRSLPAWMRAVVHALSATGVVASLGGLPHLSLGEFGGAAVVLPLGVAGPALAVLFIVWTTNLFNFMDGIDGLTGVNTAVASTAAAALVLRDQPGLRVVVLALAGASTGFVIWNWSPARIFMGDVGSGFIGFVVGALVLASERFADAPASSPAALWLMLLAPYVADATITLVRRIVRGQTWYAAHRQHAYQRLVQAGWSHARVVVAIATMTGLLSAVAAFAAREQQLVIPGLVIGAVTAITCYALVERARPMD